MTWESRWVASWEVRAQVRISEGVAGFLGSCPPGFPLELEKHGRLCCEADPVTQVPSHLAGGCELACAAPHCPGGSRRGYPVVGFGVGVLTASPRCPSLLC